MVPLSTSPVPAVARRASPSATTRTSPSGAATTVVGPLRSTTAPASVGEGPGGRQPVGLRPTAGEALVLAVVRGEHRRGRPGRASRATSRPSAVRPSPSTTAGRSVPASTSRTADLGRRRRAQPRTDDERLEPRRRRRGPLRPIPPTAAPTRPPRWGGPGRRRTPGRAEAHHAGSGSLGGGRRQVAGAGHPGGSGDHQHAGRPLVSGRRPRREPPGDVRRPPPRPAVGVAHVEADVGDDDRAGDASDRARARGPGFSAAKVTVRTAWRARPRSSPVRAVDAARDVDRQHRRAAGTRAAWCSPRKPVP